MTETKTYMDLNKEEPLSMVANSTDVEKFYQEIVEGLSAESKYLPSRYFYDQKGDELFQEIMACDDGTKTTLLSDYLTGKISYGQQHALYE